MASSASTATDTSPPPQMPPPQVATRKPFVTMLTRPPPSSTMGSANGTSDAGSLGVGGGAGSSSMATEVIVELDIFRAELLRQKIVFEAELRRQRDVFEERLTTLGRQLQAKNQECDRLHSSVASLSLRLDALEHGTVRPPSPRRGSSVGTNANTAALDDATTRSTPRGRSAQPLSPRALLPMQQPPMVFRRYPSPSASVVSSTRPASRAPSEERPASTTGAGGGRSPLPQRVPPPARAFTPPPVPLLALPVPSLKSSLAASSRGRR